MAYGVYNRTIGESSRFSRCGEWRKSERSRIGERFYDYRFETLEEAKQFETNYKTTYPNKETKIKEVK